LPSEKITLESIYFKNVWVFIKRISIMSFRFIFLPLNHFSGLVRAVTLIISKYDVVITPPFFSTAAIDCSLAHCTSMFILDAKQSAP
jgi:hypothetical protein